MVKVVRGVGISATLIKQNRVSGSVLWCTDFGGRWGRKVKLDRVSKLTSRRLEDEPARDGPKNNESSIPQKIVEGREAESQIGHKCERAVRIQPRRLGDEAELSSLGASTIRPCEPLPNQLKCDSGRNAAEVF